MKFSGLCSLKRNGSPGCNTRKVLDPLGCQKLTSSGISRVRWSYQFLSVTPTQIFIGEYPSESASAKSLIFRVAFYVQKLLVVRSTGCPCGSLRANGALLLTEQLPRKRSNGLRSAPIDFRRRLLVWRQPDGFAGRHASLPTRMVTSWEAKFSPAEEPCVWPPMSVFSSRGDNPGEACPGFNCAFSRASDLCIVCVGC